MPRSILFLPSADQRLHLGARLLDPEIGFESSDNIQKMARAIVLIRWIELQWQPHFGGVIASGWKDVARRHHTNHGCRLRIDFYFFTNDVFLLAERAPP